jgi:hypothetical protein
MADEIIELIPGGEAENGQTLNQATEIVAKATGWVPKEQFRGPEEKWVDASTYVERGRKFNTNLQKEVTALRSEVQGFEQTKAQFQRYMKETLAAKQAEFDEAIKELRRQKAQATREGDDEAVIGLEDRLEALKKSRQDLEVEAAPQKPTREQNEVTPEFQAWAEENAWFKDAKMRSYSIALAEELRAAGDATNGRPFMDKITSLIKAEFPHKFQSQTRANSVESGSQASGGGAGGRTAADLPEADRALMEEFDKNGWVKKADFLKNYRWK